MKTYQERSGNIGLSRVTRRSSRRAGIAALIGATATMFAVAGDGVTTAPATHRGAIVTIEDEINDVTLASMKRRVERARKDGADLVIFEMNTPGGLVSSALEICTYIKNITDLKTVAWVKPSAYSAGAMISLACNEIVMASSSQIGDCAPIVISPTEGLQELGKTERAKAESPILKVFRDNAIRNHYDPLLCEAMVRQGYEIWWVEKGVGGERRFVLKHEKEKLLGEKKSPWRLVETMTDSVSGRQVPVRQPVVEDRDLLTLTQSEAVAFGFAKAIVSSESELRSHYGITGALERFTTTWSEDVADFLSSPVVRTILMMLIMLGVYAEFNAPGHFVGGAVALIALMIFLGAPYLTGVADAWEILLVVLGGILLGVEIFVLPGFGVAGILGILLIFVGFIATFVPGEPGPIIVPRMPGTWLGVKTGIQVVFGGLGLAIVGMWALNKFLPKMPVARGLLLAPAAPTSDIAAGLDIPAGPQQVVQLGDRGSTLTQLRPAGKAQINGRRMDVIAQGLLIDEGCEVEIVEISGGRVVVREVRRT